jgi:hypothetical protein
LSISALAGGLPLKEFEVVAQPVTIKKVNINKNLTDLLKLKRMIQAY